MKMADNNFYEQINISTNNDSTDSIKTAIPEAEISEEEYQNICLRGNFTIKCLKPLQELIGNTIFYGNGDKRLKEEEVLVPVKDKAPYDKGWNDKKYSRGDWKVAIKEKEANGVAVIPRYKFVFIDVDGTSENDAHNHLFNLIDDPDDQAILNNSVQHTSGKDGHYTIWLYCTPEQEERLKATGKGVTKVSTPKKEGIEFRFGDSNCVVLPPSKHNETEGYYFIDGNSPQDAYIKPTPDSVIEVILNNISSDKPALPTTEKQGKNNKKSGKQGKSKHSKIKNLCFDIIDQAITTYGDDWYEAIYNLIDHQFEGVKGKEDKMVQGYCPNPKCSHANDKSNGGRFMVDIDSNSKYKGNFKCWGCDDYWGNIIQYQALLDHNNPVESMDLTTSQTKYYAQRLVGRLGWEDKFKNQIQAIDGKPLDADDTFDVDSYGCVEELVLQQLEAKGYIVNNGAFYAFNGYYWQNVEGQVIKKKISQILRKSFTWVRVDEVLEKKHKYCTDNKLRSAFNFALANLTVEELPANDHLISFINGTLNLNTGEIKEHNKDDYLFSHLPYNYNKDDNHPEVFLQWVEATFGKEQMRTIQAFIHYLLNPKITPDYLGGGKHLHIMGKSGSGKGSLLRLLAKFFTPENTASLSSLSVLNDEKNRHRYMSGKRFAYIPDAEKFQKGLKSFYEFVDNGQLTAVPLYSNDSYTMKSNCKFAIASIDQIQIEDAGAGWLRRCIPIVTQQKAPNFGYNLEQKLQAEIGQICAWALDISCEEVRKILCTEKTTQQLELEERQNTASDSVASFINECLRSDNTDEGKKEKVDSTELWLHYLAYCKGMNLKPKGKDNFINSMKTNLPNDYYVPRKQVREGKKVKSITAHWVGIEANNNAFELREVKGNSNEKELVYLPTNAWDYGLQSFNDEEAIDYETVTGKIKILTDDKDEEEYDDEPVEYDYSKYNPKTKPDSEKSETLDSIKQFYNKNKNNLAQLDRIHDKLQNNNVAGDKKEISEWRKNVFQPQHKKVWKESIKKS